MRWILELDDQQAERLDGLLKETGVERVYLINSALTLLCWCIDQIKAGHKVGAIDETAKLYREIQIPILDKFSAASTPKDA